MLLDHSEEISGREIEEFDLEVLDYVSPAVVLRAELLPESSMRPLVEVGLAGLDYGRPRPGKRDRDATQVYLIAGAELEPSEELRVRLGLRRNERFFEEAGDSSFASTGPDLALDWEPDEHFGLELSLSRTIEEPSREDSLVEDVLAAELKAALQASERLAFTAGAEVERVDHVGIDEREIELSVFADARWQLNERLTLLAEGWNKIEGLGHDEAVHRTTIRAGIEATF